MLHSEALEGPRHPAHDSPSPPSARILIAVAAPPRLSDPARWGWPHWLAPPPYRAGGHRGLHRPLEDFR